MATGSPTEKTENTFCCTTVEVGELHRVSCFGCRCKGSAAEFPGEAIDRAEAMGWRQVNGHLFCRDCVPEAGAILQRRDFEAKLGLEE